LHFNCPARPAKLPLVFFVSMLRRKVGAMVSGAAVLQADAMPFRVSELSDAVLLKMRVCFKNIPVSSALFPRFHPAFDPIMTCAA
jgi:hypothetical protein